MDEYIELNLDERIALWCNKHNKSKFWGERITEKQLDKLGCPKFKLLNGTFVPNLT